MYVVISGGGGGGVIGEARFSNVAIPSILYPAVGSTCYRELIIGSTHQVRTPGQTHARAGDSDHTAHC